MDSYTQNVAENIAKTIEDKHISVRQLSQEIGMTETTVHKIIKGKQDIKISTLKQISKVLDVSIHYLLSPNASIFIDSDKIVRDSEMEDLKEELDILKQRLADKQTIVEFLNYKDKANQDSIIDIIKLLSDLKNKPSKEALAEIKKIKKIQTLIEYGLINPEIFG